MGLMPKRRKGNTLERWEVALIKAMLARKGSNDQDILAYFTRPTRSVNHRAIGEIRTEKKHKAVKPAAHEELEAFLATWPEVDPQTGLSLRGDELLIKARDAMIAAVHTFNGAGLTFRAELFIVTAIIAWTYLLHAWFRREGIDFRYKGAGGAIKKTKGGEDCYWELGKCLQHSQCPLSEGAVTNLEFLIELRNEIEHRSTSRIDDAVSAKLQACCINFNDTIIKLFGPQFSLERRLPIALQFVTFDSEQRTLLKKASTLPAHIATFLNAFDSQLTPDRQNDPAYVYRVAFVPKIANRPSSADTAVEFVKAGSEAAQEINRILLKEVDKKRYTAKQIYKMMQAEGYPKFNQESHTKLWKDLGAKEPGKGFGKVGDYKNTWVWYDSWVARVRAHPRASRSVQVALLIRGRRRRRAVVCRDDDRAELGRTAEDAEAFACGAVDIAQGTNRARSTSRIRFACIGDGLHIVGLSLPFEPQRKCQLYTRTCLFGSLWRSSPTFADAYSTDIRRLPRTSPKSLNFLALPRGMKPSLRFDFLQ
jgi:hypothetical protein